MSSYKAGVLAGALAFCALAEASDLPPQLEACATMRRDSERLACYDHAVAQIKAGAAADPPPSAENMFGANGAIATSPASAPELKREELQQITAKVSSMHRADGGVLVLNLDNGQTWRQQDVDVTLTISDGDAVTVQRAVFGTFRITDKRGRSARFKRVR